jgi:two-component system CheB/CheR fusion protein
MAKSKANKNEQPAAEISASKFDGDSFVITGIGASAGGIQAFQDFFQNVPANSGIAYVVILHMSPDYDSHLAQVLQTTAKMPVTQVNEKVRVEPDNVYVVPPNQHLTMSDGHIIVTPNTQIEDRRAPVDIFFRTLAEEHGSKAIAVILSGTGANGSMGLKRVKEKGGATFVQNPREAEFNEMPRNAIATGLVDEVLNVSDIPAKVIAYKNNFGKVLIMEDAEKRPPDQKQALRQLFNELRLRTGHDFSNYKRPTLLRRIERRIHVHNLPDLPSYVAYVYENPDEINALLKDLLISVTNFFRDKEAFEVIENEILPLLLKGKNPEQQVRIWVAGCATGEEAYSLGILCAERTSGVIEAPKIQIFATDIDELAITEAREGLYSINDLADVSPERLRRFFIKEGDDYRIRREVREMIMFANHNFLKDPPFSHLDLVSCRNVMIYLNNAAQKRVAETFHFALNPGGFLFLGTSESVDGATDLYALYNRENHLFRSRQAAPRNYPIPESTPRFRIDRPALSIPSEHENKVLERISFGDLHQQLLEQYAPPSIVVNEEYDIVHVSERAGRYLQIGGGEPSKNLLKLVRPELRLELRSALYQAAQQQSAVEARALKITIDKEPETINIHVRPVLHAGDTARGFILILFETSIDDDNHEEVLLDSNEPLARHLEEELMRLKAQLRSSNEQHEFQQEELKASNEELQAMNEELRSAAEELETSKEELQSINEELRTVNQELKVKVEETTLSSNNLQNLINSSDIGTIFLDRSLCVALFTPAIRRIFNLIPADYGRPLSDITNKLGYKDLANDAEAVLDKLTPVEREVSTAEGRVFLMRISPYRTAEDRINGVVITFVDITTRKESEEHLRQNLEELARFNKAMVSRESRMIELKKEINDLCQRLGEPERYPLEFEKEDKNNNV